jgi:uncharacterized protein (DUF1684 family)
MQRTLWFALLLLAGQAAAQEDSGYVSRILAHRQEYAAHLIVGERAPLQAPDTAYLDFFAPDSAYCVTADFTATQEAAPFEMPTSSGRTKTFVQHGWLRFALGGDTLRLAVYRNLTLTQEIYKDHLFLPFRDLTNGEETYGGGRYLDLSLTDIRDGKIALDFNLVYNPYCAFSDGYNCPIPPAVNHLNTAVKAGEKAFQKDH